MKNQECQNCESGLMRYDIRDVLVTRRGLEAMAPKVSGFFCDQCHEINFDQTTDSAARYASIGDELVTRARLEVAGRLKRTRLRLRLSQSEASVLSGGGHNAFSRYETGVAEPVAAVVNLFALLDQNPELLNVLRKAIPDQPR